MLKGSEENKRERGEKRVQEDIVEEKEENHNPDANTYVTSPWKEKKNRW